DQRVDGIGHGVHVPIIHFQRIVEHFGHARLLGDDDGNVGLHGLQRRYAERLGYGRHHVYVAHGEHAVHFGALQESGEVEPVGDAQTRHAPYHVVHHVAAAGHDEAHIRNPPKYLGGCFHEIVGALLIGDASQEGHDFVVEAAGRFALVAGGEPDGVVDGDDFFGRYAVPRYHDVARQVAYGYHAVGRLHARPFDVVHRLIDVFAAAVEFGGVHVHHQRFARHGLGGHAGIIGEPVVGVDDVECSGQVAGDLRSNDGVVVDLFHQ